MKKGSIVVFCLITLIFESVNAEISKTVDEFNGNIFVESYVSDSGYYKGIGLYLPIREGSDFSLFNPLISPFDSITLTRYKLTSGKTGYEIRFYNDFSVGGSFFGYNSIGTLKVGEQFVNLIKLTPPSFDIEYIYFDASIIMQYLHRDLPLTIRVQGGNGTFTWEISEPIIQEWQQLATIDFNDEQLLSLKPMGEALVANKSIVGWVRDYASVDTPVDLHVYHGQNMLFVSSAIYNGCGSSNSWDTKEKLCACDELDLSVLEAWSQWMFKIAFDEIEEHISMPSLDPITIYAINSNSNGENPIIFSEKIYLKPDFDCVFNWVESSLPELFPIPANAREEPPYYVRRYTNGSLLGAIPGSGALVFKLGEDTQMYSENLSTFLESAIISNCQ